MTKQSWLNFWQKEEVSLVFKVSAMASFLFDGNGKTCLSGYSYPVKKLTTYLNTLPKLKMHGTTHQLPPHTFITWYIIKHISQPQQYSTPRMLIFVVEIHILSSNHDTKQALCLACAKGK